MRWEKTELCIILSARHSTVAEDHICPVCGLPIYKGEKCFSYGIVDRKEGTKRRVYSCCELEPYTSFVERYMYDNRMVEEVFLSDVPCS